MPHVPRRKPTAAGAVSAQSAPLWVFGYGSLIWNPAFDYEASCLGRIHGFVRRFWQASTDHRGTEAYPGRVATLVRQSGGECWGVAFRVAEREREQVLARLDVREQGGYELLTLPFSLDPHQDESQAAPARVSVYVAGSQNPHYLGPTSEAAIATVARQASGPSGANVEYVVRLAQALRELRRPDPHVEAIERLLF